MALKLLVVDSDTQARVMIASCMQDLFDLTMVASGMAALAELEKNNPPDILLLDTDISDIDGFELCRTFKQQAPQCHTVLLWSKADRDAYIAAYDAGADDFIPKPIHYDELKQKLLVLERSIIETQTLQSSVKSATDTALQAITSSAELGSVINFFKKASIANENESLLKVLVQTTANFRLQVAAQFRYKNECITLNSEGRSSPLEAHMLQTLAQDQQKIYSLGRRLVINFPRVTLQIKDMPLDDPDRCGRLRDHIAILVEAAENRLNGILNEQQIYAQQALTLNAIGLIQASVQKLEDEYRRQASSSLQLFTQLQEQFERKMVHLGLSDGQENSIFDMISQGMNEATQIYDQGLSLDDEFSHVIATLLHLTQQSPTAGSAEIQSESDDDIMLF